jgi:hypothetical protein
MRYKQRAVIEILTAEKVPPIEIHRRMQAVYDDQCVDVSTVRIWIRRFKDGELGQADLSEKYQFFLKYGFQNLVQSWRKCAEVRGDSVEK